MDPVKVSAMFAAHVWFIERNGGGAAAEEEAAWFARRNWRAFLPCAHKGLGQLLIRLARGRSRRGRGRSKTAGYISG